MKFEPRKKDVYLVQKRGIGAAIIRWWQKRTGPVTDDYDMTHCGIFTSKHKQLEALPRGIVERRFKYTDPEKRLAVFRYKKRIRVDKQREFKNRHLGRWYSYFIIVGFGLVQWLKLDKNPFSMGNVCTKLVYEYCVQVLGDREIAKKFDKNSITPEMLYEYFENSENYYLVYER